MREVGLRTGAVIAGGVAVLAAVLWFATTVDARAPQVTGYRLTQPMPGDEDRAQITTTIEISFSEPVDTASAGEALRIEPGVGGAISWSGSTLTFTPFEPLPLETVFEVSVAAGVRDLAGNRSSEPSEPFRFETAGRPEIVETEPVADADDVPLDAGIGLTFSTLMDTTSVEEALTFVPALSHELRWSGQQLMVVPVETMRPNQRYRLRIGNEAADTTGVRLAEPFVLEFRTAADLRPAELIPRDGTDGISVHTPLAVIFDEPIDADSVSDDLIDLTPDVGGALELVAAPGMDAEDQDALRMLRFMPSAPLPSNTTFEVVLAPGIEALGGGQLDEPVTWSFTTGAPLAALSNQIVFLSARSGLTNLWTMNPDGTGQRQLSAELASVTDYAVSPDGRSFVVCNGRQLIQQQPDGTDRRVLTDEAFLEIDPAYSPDGSLIAFARADAVTGAGLGLWERSVDGGETHRIELPGELLSTPPPSPGATRSPAVGRGPLLRSPRYAPDGQALAFVDEDGRVGIVELPSERLTTVRFRALGPPVWLSDGTGVLFNGHRPSGVPPDPIRTEDGGVPMLDPAVAGLDASEVATVRVALLSRSGDHIEETGLGAAAARPAVDQRGLIAVVRLDVQPSAERGTLEMSTGPDATPRPVVAAAGTPVISMAFGPEDGQLVVERGIVGAQSEIWLLDIDSAIFRRLAGDGARPRWLP